MPSLLNRKQRERLLRRYRPDRVQILFIGEAPPASGRFFYLRDSGLYRAIRDAFRIMNSAITEETFLGVFQAAGCYLIDICGEPVDDLDSKSRQAACRTGEPVLARSIRKLQPQVIVTMLRSITGNVDRAVIRAQWHGEKTELPYPGRWLKHRAIFVKGLVSLLESRGTGVPIRIKPRQLH